MKTSGFTSFDDFYPYYLSEHASPLNRALHFAGTLLVIALAGTAAWRGSDETGGEPVVLRCGLERPAEFVVGSPIQMVNQVQWFRLEDPQSPLATWLCVDRPVYVALTLPTGSGPTPIQAMSDVIDRSIPAIEIRPAPAR
jgi:hypothetical protein